MPLMPQQDRVVASLGQTWVIIAGAAIGALTLLFFMVLIILGVMGREIPCNSVFLVNLTISFGAALSVSFIGGNASARGKLYFPGLNYNPLSISLGGGVAVLFIMLVLTTDLFGTSNCKKSLVLNCPEGQQQHVIDMLHFGFCYPREGWELDSGAISLNAADVYLRNSQDRDIGTHFHVSLIPASWVRRPGEYSKEVANTWRQLDEKIEQFRLFIGGREAYGFRLHVKDRKGQQRPAEITHIYLDSERLLEIIQTQFDDTAQSIID